MIPSKAASKQLLDGDDIFTLSGNIIPVKNTATHLGIQRDNQNSSQTTITHNISLARRTLYALLGAGLHGKNGLHPRIAFQILETFVTPRCLFGLEVLHINKTQQKEIDNFYKKTLRQLQSLPDKPPPADIAVHALAGKIPLSAQIEKQALTLFGSIARQKTSLEYELALRQLATKEQESNSWFVKINKILEKYDLPSAYEILMDAPTKGQWKGIVKRKMAVFWQNFWKCEHEKKPSLRYLNIDKCKVGVLHPVWNTSSNSRRDIRRASIKARLLTGTYVLEANRAVFNQYENVGTCSLCKVEPETREHFLVKCSALHIYRNPFMAQIESMLRLEIEEKSSHPWTNPNWLTQLILDCTHPIIQKVLDLRTEEAEQLECISRNMCFALHTARAERVFNTKG